MPRIALLGPARARTAFMAGVALLAPGFTAEAAVKVWDSGSGDWTQDSYWEPYGQPSDGDDVTYVDAGDGDETLTFERPALSLNSLTLRPSRGTITLLQTKAAGSLNLGNLTLNEAGSAVYRIVERTTFVGGTLTIGNPKISGVSALVDVQSGYLSVNHAVIANGGTLAFGGPLPGFSWVTIDQSGGVADFRALGVNGGYSLDVGGTYNLSGGAATCGTVRLVGNGRFNLAGGSLDDAGVALLAAPAGVGVFTQSGGSHTIAGVLSWLGNIGSGGAYHLQGGTLAATSIQLTSVGIFDQTGGTLNAATFNQAGGTVTGSLQNQGTFNYSSGDFAGRLLNQGAVNIVPDALVLQDGLDNRALFAIPFRRTLTLNGTPSSNSATLTMDDALLTGGLFRNTPGGTIAGSGRIVLGLTNEGTITASGGDLVLGGSLNNQGTLANAAGSNLFVQSALTHSGSVVARAGGSVVFNVAVTNAAGRSVTLAGGTVGAPSLTNVSGGTITGTGDLAADLINSGDVAFNGPARLLGTLMNNAGGTLTARNSQVLVTGPAVNAGTIHTISGGSVVFDGGVSGTSGLAAAPPTGAPSGGTGQLLVDAGGSVVANYVRQSSVSLSGNAGDAASYGRLWIRRRVDGGDTSVVSAISVQADATGAPLGRVDLADTAMIVDYPVGGTSPLSGVRALLARGYAGGTWAGDGITSSEAAGRANRALGYGEAGDVLGAGGGVFQGQPADGSSVVVRYTVAGDASLDGRVSFDDLLRLARHYNASGATATWSVGDFNYDQVVNFTDLLTLARNYNAALPAEPIPGAPGDFAADLAAAVALASVPEPGGVGVVAVGGACAVSMARSRRRRRA